MITKQQKHIRFFIILMMTTIALTNYSCKKNSINKENPVNDHSLTIAEAKVFFNSEVLPNSKLTTEAQKHIKGTLSIKDLSKENDLLFKQPIWEWAYAKKVTEGTAIAVPIHFDINSYLVTGNNKGIKFSQLNYLLITKNPNGAMTAEWVTLYPDAAWANGNRNIYTGRIMIADWDGNLLKAYVYNKNGTIINYNMQDTHPANPKENITSFAWTVLDKNTTPKKVNNVERPKDVNYMDSDGNCWTDLRQTQDPGGFGVTLTRHQIDCPPKPQGPPETPGVGADPNHNGSGGGGGGGGSNYPPANCNPDPNYVMPTGTPGPGMAYIPPCAAPVVSLDPIAKPVSPNFGLDAPDVCLNCRVSDNNFDALLAYVKAGGYTVSDPYNTTLTVNGIKYEGQATEIRNAAGDLIAAYFSPDVSSGPFQTGIEYTIGNKGPDGTNNFGNDNPTDTSIDFGSPSFYIANGSSTITLTYTPPRGPDGKPLTPAQRRVLAAADDARIINLLKQEDARDDGLKSPCRGTGRSGNAKWPGTVEHWLIQVDYMERNPLASREYYIPGSSSQQNGNAGYADIVNAASHEMFEIKPNNNTGQTAGATEIQIYVTKANASCPPANGGAWVPGINYPTRYLLDPRNPSNLIEASLNGAGVIVYSSKERNNIPRPVPVPVPLPENLANRLKKLFQDITQSPATMMEPLILAFLRQNPSIVPYLRGAAIGIVIGTIIEDIATDLIGIADDWESFVIARTLWRMSNEIMLY
jgi:hypothetical protein